MTCMILWLRANCRKQGSVWGRRFTLVHVVYVGPVGEGLATTPSGPLSRYRIGSGASWGGSGMDPGQMRGRTLGARARRVDRRPRPRTGSQKPTFGEISQRRIALCIWFVVWGGGNRSDVFEHGPFRKVTRPRPLQTQDVPKRGLSAPIWTQPWSHRHGTSRRSSLWRYWASPILGRPHVCISGIFFVFLQMCGGWKIGGSDRSPDASWSNCASRSGNCVFAFCPQPALSKPPPLEYR